MADSKFKLTYFTMKGLGEDIRYVFAYADVDFEDYRIAQADWPALKESFEYRQLPVLEVDGKTLNQSVAITRYLGKRFGLVASDPFTDALLEALTDNLRDAQKKLREAVTITKTPEAKQEGEEAMAFFLAKVEPLAANGFFYGEKNATWTDIHFFAITELLEQYFPGTLKPFPNLTALTEKIRNKPSVQKYIANRPEDKWVHDIAHHEK